MKTGWAAEVAAKEEHDEECLRGESFFVNTYTAGTFWGMDILAPSSPGDRTFDLAPGQSFYMQGGIHGLDYQCGYIDEIQGAKSLFSRKGLSGAERSMSRSVFFTLTGYEGDKSPQTSPSR